MKAFKIEIFTRVTDDRLTEKMLADALRRLAAREPLELDTPDGQRSAYQWAGPITVTEVTAG